MNIKKLITLAACSALSVSASIAQDRLQIKALIVDAATNEPVARGLVAVERISNGLIWYRLRPTDPQIQQKKLVNPWLTRYIKEKK